MFLKTYTQTHHNQITKKQDEESSWKQPERWHRTGQTIVHFLAEIRNTPM